MANFDIISAAGNAYQTGWAARRYLVRLAAVPFIIKLVCFILAGAYMKSGGEKDAADYLTFILIMMPSFLAEGWMLSHYTRFLIWGQTWPFRPTGNMEADMPVLKDRARGVLSGLIVFTLINLVLGFLMAAAGQFLMPYVDDSGNVTADDIPPYLGFVSLFSLIATFWGFRLLWIYIPYAVGMNAKDYLRGIKGPATSLHMIGVWLLCSVPFFLVLRIFAAIIGEPVSMAFGEAAGSFIVIIVTVLLDTIQAIITTAGITFGLKEIFSRERAEAR